MRGIEIVKVATFLILLSQIQLKMKKYILIDNEIVNALMKGKCVDGSIRKTKEGLMFRAYNHVKKATGTSEPDKMLYQTACGHLKESRQRYRMWVSVPKTMGMCKAANMLEIESGEMTGHLYRQGLEEEGGMIDFKY